jgi:hypothetical protein
MKKCSEYEKYFHDYVDEVLSQQKQRDYKDHVDRCSFCTGMLQQDERYRDSFEASTKSADLPSGLDLRFKGRFRFMQLEELADPHGFVSEGRMTDWLRKEVDKITGAAKTVNLMGKPYSFDEYIAGMFSGNRSKQRFQEG